MADLLRLGVVLDPSQTSSGAAQIKRELDGIGQQADRMQQTVTAAAGRLGVTLGNAGQAGTRAGADVARGGRTGADGIDRIDPAARRAISALNGVGESLRRMFEFAGGGLLLDFFRDFIGEITRLPIEAIKAGIEFDDQMKRSTIIVAGLLTQINPKAWGDWNEAMRVSSQVMGELYTQSQKVHVPLTDLVAVFQPILRGTKEANMSLRETIGLASQVAAAVKIADPFAPAMQVQRDINDLLSGGPKGTQTVIGRQIIDQNGLKDAYAAATTELQRAQVVQQGATMVAIAAGHMNEVLSATYDNLKASITAAIGKEVTGLYAELVAQINRVRDVLQFSNFDGMKPFIDQLQKAVVLAGNLAVALATNPKELGTYLLDIMKAAWQSSIEFLVSIIPYIIPALVSAFQTLGPLMIDIMFTAAAVLVTTVQSVFAMIDAKYDAQKQAAKLGADSLNPLFIFQDAGSRDAGHPEDSWLVQQANKLQAAQNTAQNGFDPATFNATIQNNLKQNLGQAGSIKDYLSNVITGDTPKSPNTPQTADQLWAKVAADGDKIANAANALTSAANAQKAAVDAAKAKEASPNFVGPRQRSDLDIRTNNPNPDPTKQDYIKQAQQKIDDDRLAAMEAEATGNQKLIDQANNLVKIDQYRKELIDHVNSAHEVTAKDMDIITQKTQKYADAIAALTNRIEARKGLMNDINVAEEQAAAARNRVQEIQQDPFITQLAKRPELIASYDKEISALQKVIALNQQAINSGTLKDEGAIAARQREINKANQEIVQAKVAEALQTDSGVFKADLVKYMDSLGSAGSQAAGIITGTLNSAISSTSNEIMKVIQGTETWGQAFQKIGMDILNTLEQLIIKMALTQAIQSSLGAVMGGAGGGAGALGGLFAGATAGGYHQGGIVGIDQSFTRQLPHYHSGGMAENEHLAVLQRGERVQTRNQQKQEAPAQQPIHVHVVHFSDPNEIGNYIQQHPDAILTALGRSPGMTKQLNRR